MPPKTQFVAAQWPGHQMHEHRSTGVALSPQHLCCKAHTPLSPPPSQERAKPPNIHSYFAPLHTPQSFRGPCHSTRTADRVVELCSQSFSANPTACTTGGSGCHSLPICAHHPLPSETPCPALVSWHTWCCTQSGCCSQVSFLLRLPCVGVFAPELPDEAKQVVPMC